MVRLADLILLEVDPEDQVKHPSAKAGEDLTTAQAKTELGLKSNSRVRQLAGAGGHKKELNSTTPQTGKKHTLRFDKKDVENLKSELSAKKEKAGQNKKERAGKAKAKADK